MWHNLPFGRATPWFRYGVPRLLDVPARRRAPPDGRVRPQLPPKSPPLSALPRPAPAVPLPRPSPPCARARATARERLAGKGTGLRRLGGEAPKPGSRRVPAPGGCAAGLGSEVMRCPREPHGPRGPRGSLDVGCVGYVDGFVRGLGSQGLARAGLRSRGGLQGPADPNSRAQKSFSPALPIEAAFPRQVCAAVSNRRTPRTLGTTGTTGTSRCTRPTRGTGSRRLTTLAAPHADRRPEAAGVSGRPVPRLGRVSRVGRRPVSAAVP